MSVTPLAYEALLDIHRKDDPIVAPNGIPIHPKVYDSDFAFTPEFIEEVRRSVPDSIREDISVMLTILPEHLLDKLNLEVDDKKITKTEKGSYPLVYNSIDHIVRPDSKFLYVGVRGSNIAIDRVMAPCELVFCEEHPMTRDPMTTRKQLEEYAFEFEERKPKAHTWFVHDFPTENFPLALYFRNFAIMFNNLGLKKLEEAGK